MHVIETELLQSTPRPVRRKPFLTVGSSRWGAGCLGLFLLPFFVIGLGALLYALSLTSTLIFGTTTPGTVIAQEVISNDEGSDSYRITYRYEVGGVRWTGKDDVERQQFTSLVAETPVTVKYFLPMPGTNSVLDGVTNAPKRVGFLWLWIAIWDGVLGSMLFVGVRALLFQRRLVQLGRPTTACIREKTCVSDSDSSQYHLHYSFRTESGRDWSDKRMVSKEEWDRVREGEMLTALYLPDAPQKHDLYRFCAYEATR
jgi:hypothetical protein